MKKIISGYLAVLLSLFLCVSVLADAPVEDNPPDYATDYYMIVECADGGIYLYADADLESSKLLEDMIPNGTGLYIEGEKVGKDKKDWGYVLYHGGHGYVPLDDLRPCTRPEAIQSELGIHGWEDTDYELEVNAEDGSVPLYYGPGEKYQEISKAGDIPNGEKLRISRETQDDDGTNWGLTEAAGTEGWVNLDEANNKKGTSQDLVDMTEDGSTSGNAPAAAADSKAAEATPSAAGDKKAAELTPEAADDKKAAEVTPEAADDSKVAELTPEAADDKKAAELTPEAAGDKKAAELTPEATQDSKAVEVTPSAAGDKKAADLTPAAGEGKAAAATTALAEEDGTASPTSVPAEEKKTAGQTAAPAADSKAENLTPAAEGAAAALTPGAKESETASASLAEGTSVADVSAAPDSTVTEGAEKTVPSVTEEASAEVQKAVTDSAKAEKGSWASKPAVWAGAAGILTLAGLAFYFIKKKK